MMLVNNWMVSFGIFLLSIYLNHILCNANLVWMHVFKLNPMNIVYENVLKTINLVSMYSLMIAYVCCWYLLDCNFLTYNICKLQLLIISHSTIHLD
jgi:hypothetical protein